MDSWMDGKATGDDKHWIHSPLVHIPSRIWAKSSAFGDPFPWILHGYVCLMEVDHTIIQHDLTCCPLYCWGNI